MIKEKKKKKKKLIVAGFEPGSIWFQITGLTTSASGQSNEYCTTLTRYHTNVGIIHILLLFLLYVQNCSLVLVVPLQLWLHHCSYGYTTAAMLTPLQLWLHQCSYGYTTAAMVTPLQLWLHHCSYAYTTAAMVTPLQLWLHHCSYAYTLWYIGSIVV